MLSGHTKSCGCLHKLTITKHGSWDTVEFKAWSHMMGRCYKEKNNSYKDYGGRGISVCESWHDPVTFIRDMGARPSKNHSLDRIDVNSGYYCGKCQDCVKNGWENNCQWATKIQQARNKRNNRIIEYNGMKKTLSDWQEVTGIQAAVIRHRIDRYGWTVERALTIKPKLGGWYDR